ncbi:MAG: cytochrome c [Burkholderiales bacterium]|nr:cytochrome c [Burkholderiales bacterium]
MARPCRQGGRIVRIVLAAGIALLLAPPLAARGDELGRKVFTQIAQPACAICHTLKAAGAVGTVGPSLDELRPDRARVMDAVKNGVGVMPPFAGKLTAEQIEAVVAFVAGAAGGQ